MARTAFSLATAQQRRALRRMARTLQVEGLERRELLAAGAATTTPTILGVVFSDGNGNGIADAGEGIQGATIRLYADDGDGTFNAGTDSQVGSDATTDANGDYCFDNLDADTNYFVVQPAQTVGSNTLAEQVSALQDPGAPGLLIDDFITTQAAVASPPAPSATTAVNSFPNENEVIGAERDMVAMLDTGDGEVEMEVNPFGTRDTLRYNSDVGVTGSGQVVWDGQDLDASVINMGLAGRDLTNGGTETGIVLRIGAVVANATATVRLYEGSAANSSEASLSIPVTTSGIASSYQFIPFSSFSGAVTPDDVDAIELLLDADASGANDIEVAMIGAIGPKTVDFSSTPTVDLMISKTDNRADVTPGEQLTYTVVATNNGPSAATGATITDAFPAELTNATYTSTVTGGATGNTANGSGDINDTVDMPVGSTITYTIQGTVDPAATGTITNTASIAAPNGLVETDTNNNNAIDVDNITPTADLQITKTDNVENAVPGRQVTYTIVVTNAGPSDVSGATVVDNFPADIQVTGYSSSTTGTVSGNTVSGTGDINDTVDMTSGSTLTYTVDATISSSATGTITNTATVTAPQSITDSNLDNNSATDIDVLDPELDLAITKTDNVASVEPNDSVTYTIVVSNSGPADAIGATVTDTFPAELTNVSYTSTGTAGTSGNTAGSGNINDTVTIPSGGSITYTATGTVTSNASGTVENTATVSAPSGFTDTLTSNNTATDVDAINPSFDLAITKDNNVTSVVAGSSTTYTIQVSNSGPSDVVGATVSDIFPAQLTNVTYTSVASGGATGNTLSGSGDLADTINLPASASVTYTVNANIDASATGTITNTATVTAPSGQVTEANTANNTASDTDTVTLEADLAVSKTDNDSVVRSGDTVNYQIQVSNNGPSDVVGATFNDNLPVGLTGGTYSSVASGGAAGNGSGSGNVSETLNLPVGSSVTYTVSATVNDDANGTLTNTATINSPAGITETNASNNTSSDINTVERILRSISGFVYVDADGDGVFDSNEQPIVNVGIALSGVEASGGAVVNRSTTTGSNGAFAFNDLNPGTYTVTQTQPAAFDDGIETPGTGSTTDVQTTDNVFANIGLGTESDAVNFNFGEVRSDFSKRELFASRYR